MKTITLTPEVLRALSQGIDRLNDGDLKDRAQADSVQADLEAMGFEYRSGNLWDARPVKTNPNGGMNNPKEKP